MICARCDQRIKGEPVRHDILSPTGPGATIYLCPKPCHPAAPRQTAPVGMSPWRRF